MAKRVLIVENSLAVRGIAESLLRQNGYEVVAADSADVAKSILNDTKIDLLLVASDIVDSQGQKFYEFAGAGSATATIPLLVFHDSTSGVDIPFPPEAIIQKPFTPADFLSSISAFTGGGDVRSGGMGGTPFDGADFEDDIIDAALGLDKLDINDSEVIGNDTGVFRIQNKKNSKESMIGYEFDGAKDETSKSHRNLDQINVPADQHHQRQQAPKQQPPAPQPKRPQPQVEEPAEFLGNDTKKVKGHAPDLTESSKIEIITDQYGISVPEADLQPEAAEDDVHDYNWFINELKNEAEGKKAAAQQAAPAPQPHKPAPAPQQKPASSGGMDNVDDFISEFKKEMEKISDDLDPSLGVTNIAPPSDGANVDLEWKESVADVPDGDIKTFSKDLVNTIASSVARKIIASLDEDKLYRIIKEVIDENIRSQFKKTS
ncbi:MAG: hypothetical protein R3F48_07580 [Candidatus Zixiibacteriota bacterium]